MLPLRLLLLLALAAAASAETPLTVDQLQADFGLFQKSLEEAHSGLYRYTSKRDMDALFQKASRKLDRSLTTAEFHNVLTPVIAAIRCGHTGVSPTAELRQQASEAMLVPLRVQFDERRAVVLVNQSTNEQIRPGMQLLAVNGLSMDKVLDRILPNLPADGDIETGALRRLGRMFPLAYWNYVDPATSYRLRLRGSNRTTVEVAVNGVLEREAEAAAAKNPVNERVLAGLRKLGDLAARQHLRYPEAPATAIIRIPNFGGAGYPDFIKKSFAEIKEKGTRTLIIDVRGNGGGADLYGALLVSHITGKPFRYFERIHWNTFEPSFRKHTDFSDGPPKPGGVSPDPAGGWLLTPQLHKGLAEQKPASDNFAGTVYVLIDGGSFSTTADFCAITRRLGRATFVGEETGGGYDGNNSGASLRLTLPASKLQVGIPMWEYFNAVKRGSRRGTIPDHRVAVRVSDIEQGIDTVLEYTLGLIRQ